MTARPIELPDTPETQFFLSLVWAAAVRQGRVSAPGDTARPSAAAAVAKE